MPLSGDAAGSLTAIDIVARVNARELDPTDLVRDCIERIDRYDDAVGAFAHVRRDRVIAESALTTTRLADEYLPLAGVPVAVKDNVAVEGEIMRSGSQVFEGQPQKADHPVVGRLRAAGASIVGMTTMPELDLWLTTDGDVVTRNPWNRERSASGASGGSAAAVAAGFVTAAHGNDGLGSLRQPAAACGLVGMKPGRGLVPAGLPSEDWYGLAENGPITSSVEDAALMLSVMTGDPALAVVNPPRGVLRFAVSVRAPMQGVRTDADITRAIFGFAGLLRREGHVVERAHPAYPKRLSLAGTFRWFSAAADAVDQATDTEGFQDRSIGHASTGRRVRPLVKDDQLADWRKRAEAFFDDHDVMVTPVTASPPLLADRWSERGWAANVRANVTASGGFAGMWNVAGFPAITVPFGIHPVAKTPIGVQLAAPSGSESLLLGIAALVQRLRPWPRIAPGWD